MKFTALMMLVAGTLACSACTYRLPQQNEMGATPGLSLQERAQQIDSNWAYEGQQSVDDLDHFLLLRPASHLTTWNVR